MINQFILPLLVAGVMTSASLSADVLAKWTFDNKTGAYDGERLDNVMAASGVRSGLYEVGNLTMNASFGYVLGFGDRSSIPDESEPNNDQFGFYGNDNGTQGVFSDVIALHRASNPDGGVTSSWGNAARVEASVADATMFFTVSADAGSDVTIESLTVERKKGGAMLIQFNPEGAVTSPDYATLGSQSGDSVVVSLNGGPIVVQARQTKTFMIQLNSGAHNQTHLINEIALNGSVARTGSLVTIPELSTFTLFAGVLALGAAMIRRRRDECSVVVR
jgi:hypothetical protein